MAPLFSKADSNKLWHDIQHEENVIYAQFGKDLFNISKVTGRKKVAQFFWLTVYILRYHCKYNTIANVRNKSNDYFKVAVWTAKNVTEIN